jgi:hypothetical protein
MKLEGRIITVRSYLRSQPAQISRSCRQGPCGLANGAHHETADQIIRYLCTSGVRKRRLLHGQSNQPEELALRISYEAVRRTVALRANRQDTVMTSTETELLAAGAFTNGERSESSIGTVNETLTIKCDSLQTIRLLFQGAAKHAVDEALGRYVDIHLPWLCQCLET